MPPPTLAPPKGLVPNLPSTPVAPGIAPVPSTPYNPAAAAAANPSLNNRGSPELTAALQRYAKTPRPGTAAPPPEPTSPTEKAATESRPPDLASHVKFIPSDERTAEPEKTPAIGVRPSDTGGRSVETGADQGSEVAPEVLKSANAQLRDAFARTKEDLATRIKEGDLTRKELKEYQVKLTSYEDKIKAMEPELAKAKELESRWLAADEQLRIVNYTQHPEFHDKYVKPVAAAVTAAHELVGQVVVDPDGEPRAGTAADFDAVLGAANLTEATRVAKALFGPDLAPTFVQHRQTVLAAVRAREAATKEAAVKSTEFVRQRSEQDAAARTATREAFIKASNGLAEKYASVYVPPSGDGEAEAARKSGEALANLVVHGRPDTMDSGTYIENVAKIWHRASAMPMVELKLTRAIAERDALAAKLAAYEKSEPSLGGRGTSDGSVGVAAGDDLSARLKADLSRYANGGQRRRG